MDDQQKARLDTHAVEALITLAELSTEGEIERADHYVLGYTGADLPSYNFFIPLRLAGLTDESLADASAFFNTRHTMYSVSLEEHRVPDGTEYLSRRRYQPLPPQPIVATTEMPTSIIPQQKLTIEAVSTVPDLTAFYSILRSVYDFTPEEVMLLYPSTHLQTKRLRHYLGYTPDGTPVTAGTTVCSNGVASVWNLGTLDEYRRQGLASILLNGILFDAAQHGCDMSLVYATPMGFSLFNSLGYQLYAMRQWFLPQEID